MPIHSEEDWLRILPDEARDCYFAWRKLGRGPQAALDEVQRAGLWVDQAKLARYLRRPVAFYVRRLGNRYAPAEACSKHLPLAGRVLASWQCLTPQEISWLKEIAAGNALSSELEPDDVTEILAINEQSATELAGWLQDRGVNDRRQKAVARLSDEDRAVDRFWWRSEPVSYWSARWPNLHPKPKG